LSVRHGIWICTVIYGLLGAFRSVHCNSESLRDLILDPNIFLLVSMLSTAFMAHHNAPKFYWELEDNTLERYQLVVNTSFGISLLLFVAVASFGFGTFGTACKGLVLKHYATNGCQWHCRRLKFALWLSTGLCWGPRWTVGFAPSKTNISKQCLAESNDSGFAGHYYLFGLFLERFAQIVGLERSDIGECGDLSNAYLHVGVLFQNDLKPELKSEVPWVVATGILGLFMGIVGAVRAIQS
jgi:hypothetical protein